jgi:hypothetical protein
MQMTVVAQDEDRTKLALKGRLDTAGVDQVETLFTINIVTRGRNTLVFFRK